MKYQRLRIIVRASQDYLSYDQQLFFVDPLIYCKVFLSLHGKVLVQNYLELSQDTNNKLIFNSDQFIKSVSCRGRY